MIGPRWVVAGIGLALAAVARLIGRESARRRAIDEAFRRGEEQFQGAFDAAAIGMAIVAIDGRWLRVNSALTEIVGYTEAELLATDSRSITHPDDLGDDLKSVGRLLSGEVRSYQMEKRYVHKSGRVVSALLGASIVRDRSGNPLYFVARIEDITPKKRAEGQLREALWALRMANDRLNGIIEGAGDMIAALDLDFRFIAFNSAYRADFLRAFNREVKLGMSLIEALDHLPEGRDKVLELWERALFGEEFTVEQQFGGEGPGRRSYETSFSSIRDGEGRRIGSSHIVRDVTERREAEEAADRERQRLREVIRHAPAAMALLDDRLEYLACSARWVADHGLEGRDLLCRSHLELFPDLPTRWKEAFRMALGGEFASDPEDTLTRPDGTTMHLRWAIQPWRDADGRIGGVIVVTERIDELVNAREAALAASKLKSDFLANVSHEIRTPLSGVIGMADLLLGTPLDDLQREYASTVAGSGSALLTIINDILDLSKIEADKMVLDAVDFNLRHLMEEIAELLAPRAHQKGLQITCHYPTALPERFSGDPARLRQVLTNLVGNAVKFTDRGEVELSASMIGASTVRVSVRDTGIGIPPGKHEAIFEGFTQADGGINRRYGGTGLGLTICRRLARLMGGDVVLDSREGEGSTFRLDLPLPIAATADPGRPAVPTALSGLRVMIADGAETARRVVADYLRSWGCRVDEADSPDRALALLDASSADDPYGLALVDSRFDDDEGGPASLALLSVPVLWLRSIGGGEGRPGSSTRPGPGLLKPVRRSRLLAAIVERLGLDREGSAGSVASTSAPARGESPGLGLRILLAEDQEVNRKVAVRMLAQLGCPVEAVADGRGAVEALERRGGDFDVVLMDVQMPGLDGLAATRAIRRREVETGRARVPILAMTAHAMEADRLRCLEAGMDGHLSKPVTRLSLREGLAGWAPEAPRPAAAVGIDEGTLLDRCGGDPAFVAELLASFFRDGGASVAAIGRSIEAGDLPAAADLAHGLKGAASTVAAPALADACSAFEASARSGRVDAARPSFSGVVDAWEGLMATRGGGGL